MIAAAAVALAGCGSTAPSAIDATVAAGSTHAATTVAHHPARILPLDGDLAEIVFALGLGDEVVATDISATFPPEADALPEIGYQRALATEPILTFEPTIVLATDIAGPPEVLDELRRLDVEVVMIPTSDSPTGPGAKIRAVAEALGVADAGAALAADVDAQIDAASRRAADAPTTPRIAVLYLRGEHVQLLFGQGTGMDWIIDAVGGVDIADDLGVVGTAPINAEAIVVAAPEVIIVPERGLESVGGIDDLLAIPGLAATPAGAQRRVLTYDDQFLLGNGPRTGELLDQLITDLYGGTI